MKAFWDNLNRRDQLALLILGSVLAVYLLWLLLIRPVGNAVEQERLRAVAAQESLGRVQVMAAKLKAYRTGAQESQAPTTTLADVVNRSLQANQLSMSGFTPSRDAEARLRLENVSFNQLLAWLYQLETEYRINVMELTVNPSRDPGIVSVNVRLRKG